jgi:tetratricopeptide (TPR) repeat protein
MIKNAKRAKWCLGALILGWGFLSIQSAFAGQTTQPREIDVDRLLVQANSYYQKADYKLAIGCYLEAAALSKNKMNLSQAYFGLSLCYYYLRDTANAAKYMRKVVEVDPNKEISELFYPKSFVQLFNQVQTEIADKKKLTTEQAAIEKPVPEKAEEQKPVKDEKKITEEAAIKEAEVQKTEERPKAEEKKDTQPPAKTVARQPLEPLRTEEFEISEEMGGHWEINGHYSSWSINFIETLFEDALTDKLGKEIQDEIVKKSGTIQAGLVKLNYTQDLAFDSGGSSYGFEIRYFSRGRSGTFSLGLAFEKMDIKLSLNGKARQEFTSGAVASADVESNIVTSPFATHVNFRWEVGSNARITPYFVAGFGFAPLKGTFSYTYSGTYHKGDLIQTIADSKEKTLVELSQDIDFKIPELLVILQLHFGVKAQLYEGLSLIGEAGFWDGFVFRGGLAYRF